MFAQKKILWVLIVIVFIRAGLSYGQHKDSCHIEKSRSSQSTRQWFTAPINRGESNITPLERYPIMALKIGSHTTAATQWYKKESSFFGANKVLFNVTSNGSYSTGNKFSVSRCFFLKSISSKKTLFPTQRSIASIMNTSASQPLFMQISFPLSTK